MGYGKQTFFFCLTFVSVSSQLMWSSNMSWKVANTDFQKNKQTEKLFFPYCTCHPSTRGIYFSESVNFAPTYLTTSVNFFPFYAHIFINHSWISSPISILAELFPYPKEQGICKNMYPCFNFLYLWNKLTNYRGFCCKRCLCNWCIQPIRKIWNWIWPDSDTFCLNASR